MNKTFVLLSCLLSFSFVSIHAEDKEGSNEQQSVGLHCIGVAAGFTTGGGLSYRYWFGNEYGVQATILPLHRKEKDMQETDISLGITGLRTFFTTRYIDLVGYVGARGQYMYEKNNRLFAKENEYEKYTATIGGGPGFNINLSRLSLNFLFGIRGTVDSEGGELVTMTSEVAAYYCFPGKRR